MFSSLKYILSYFKKSLITAQSSLSVAECVLFIKAAPPRFVFPL